MTAQLPLGSLLCLCAIASGCSSIPKADILTAPFTTALSKRHSTLPLRAVIAPVSIKIEDAGRKGYSRREVATARDIQRALKRSIGKLSVFQSVAEISIAEKLSLDDLAWRQGSDLIIETELVGMQARFVGHSGWWIPNIVNWAYFLAPSWWVATDDYELVLTARIRLRLVDQTEPILATNVSANVTGRFNEFDRGWRWFGLGIILGESFNNRENWQRIARRLFPAGASSLAQVAAVELGPQLEKIVGSDLFERRARRTLGLCVGIDQYATKQEFQPDPASGAAASAFANSLERFSGQRQTKKLSNANATLSLLRRAIDQHLRRARARDDVYIFFSLRSVVTNGEAYLLLYDADDATQSRLSIPRLAELLSGVAGSVTVLFETDFQGAERSSVLGLFTPLTGRGINVICAGTPGVKLPPTEVYPFGLFTRHLIRGFGGRADLNSDKRVTFKELAASVPDAVESEAGLYNNSSQRPLAYPGEKKEGRKKSLSKGKG